MTNTATAALNSTHVIIPWAQLPERARENFTHWLNADPAGKTVAAEADGDMDFALWLIAVDLTYHQLTGKSYTTVADADWRGRYDAGRTPGQAIYDTTRATQ
jgi:hypothetical protein